MERLSELLTTVASSGPRATVLGAFIVIVAILAAAALFLNARRKRAGRAGKRDRERGRAGARDVHQGLARTRSTLLKFLEHALGREQLDESVYEALEEALLAADVGTRLTAKLVGETRRARLAEPAQLRLVLKEQMQRILGNGGKVASEVGGTPRVILVVGVNGVGKTTTVGKLAARYAGEGKKVMVVAADTFRAAAIEQLEIWAKRAGAVFIRQQPGGDPAAVVFDGMRAALARKVDVALVDTAGRLHTKKNLMEELRKVRRVAEGEVEGAPHETLLVLDATTGQNGLAQAQAFLSALQVTGLVITKLDGTAKGGIVLAVKEELGIPVRYVGVGEGAEDLRPFDAAEFVEALLGKDGS